MKIFSYEHTITPEDTSAESDVYWNNFGSLFGRAREHFLKSFLPEIPKIFQFLKEERGITIATQDFYSKFCKPIYHEDIVLVNIYICELNPASAVMAFSITNKITGELHGEGKQKVVFINLEKGKPTRLPLEIKEVAKQYMPQ